MSNRRSITVAVEMHRVVRLSWHAHPVRAWCGGCTADSPMATREVAALLAGIGRRGARDGIEPSPVHTFEMPDGTVGICIGSLGLDSTE